MILEDFIKNYHNPNSLYMNVDKQWLWLRIHKTAGTSMYDVLKEECWNDPKRHSKKAKEWKATITESELKKYTIFSCVRNPYDRFNSIAAMFGMSADRLANEFDLFRGKGIIERHSEPQHKFTHYKGKPMIDYLIKFENIDSDFNNILDVIGIKQVKLPKLNVSKSKSTKMSNSTINFINTFYDLDFKYFNYQKQ